MLYRFIEKHFFSPSFASYLALLPLLPLSILYALIMFIRRKIAKQEEFPIPIISIGNLIVGGSGKTPFAIELAKKISPNYKIAYILRGYKRKSKGLIVVRDKEIKSTPKESGDEAYMAACELKDAIVIVSEDRKEAIKKAIELGGEVIILDDGFNRVDIKKFEILLEPYQIKNYFTLPYGPFRELIFTKKFANLILKEEIDFKREITFENLKDKMALVTAISNPKKLDRYLPKGVVKKFYFKDHYFFNKEELKMILKRYKVDSILVTQKDYVKIKEFNIPISLMKLNLKIKSDIFFEIENYIKDFYAKKD